MSMSAGPNVPAPPRTWGAFVARRASLLLVLSLAVNLLVVGAVAGAAFLHKRWGPMGPVFGASSLTPGEVFAFVRTLPAERRGQIKQVVMAERKRIQELRAAVQRQRVELGKQIAGDSVDTAAFSAASDRLWTAEGDLRRMQLSVLGALVSTMTKTERTALASWRNMFSERSQKWTDRDEADADTPGRAAPP